LELKHGIPKWTRARSAAETVAILQEVHFPAMEVMTDCRLPDNPHLEAREWFKLRSHPAMGNSQYPGHTWRAGGFDLAWGTPVPSLGEDTEYVYQHVLGHSASAAEIERLTTKGLIDSEQRA
jgi:crotonobetainyl-CoA:carnitine CoA-transferase CaiB-like acyl-CoA transferase